MPPRSGGRARLTNLIRESGPDQLGEQLKQGGRVVITAQHDHRGGDGQLLDGGDSPGQVGIARADHVEQVARVNDQVRMMLPGVADDLGQDGVVVLGTGLIVGDPSQVPIRNV
jgi:hypothetical protein